MTRHSISWTVSCLLRSSRQIGLMLVLLAMTYSRLLIAQETSIPVQAHNAYQQGNYTLAMSLWQPLAESGYPDAQYAIGILYLRGEGVEPDPQQAVNWFERAAQQNHAGAMFNLGIAYWQGQGLQQDPQQAVNWWRRAAVLNDVSSQYNLGLAYYNGIGVEKDLLQATYWVHEAAENNHPEAVSLFSAIEDSYPEIAQQFSTSPLNITPGSAVLEYGGDSDPSISTQIPPPPIDIAEQQSAVEIITPAFTPRNNQTRASSPNHLAVADTNVHTGPAENTPVLEALSIATPVTIIEEKNGWLRVNYPGDRVVWVYGDFIASQGNLGLVVAGRLNARPQPSTGPNSTPVGQFLQGDVVHIIGNRGDWLKVVAPETLSTWVKADQVRTLANPAPS